MLIFGLKCRTLCAFSLWLICFNSFVYQNVAFVVPKELPSLLAIIYSNIPTIKKGTDSRLGFGFRLGEHADFQILVELGPQKETRPVGEGDKDQDQYFNKRQVTEEELRALKIKLLKQQIREQQQQQDATQEMTSTERTAATWLQTWSKDMQQEIAPKSQSKTTKTQIKRVNSAKATSVLPTAVVMQQGAMKQLQQLYEMATSSSTTTTTTPAPFKGGPLQLGAPAGFKRLPAALMQDTNLLTIANERKTKTEITKELMNVSLENTE